MSKNKMSEVAKLLNLELREEFKIQGLSQRYRLTNIGLQYNSETEGVWYTSNKLLPMLLAGEISIIKVEQPILDDIEKEYLSAVIRPFRDRIIYIAKAETVKTYSPNAKVYECIYIMYKDSSKKKNPFYMGFPCFKKGTMYKGMILDKGYTLEELGL